MTYWKERLNGWSRIVRLWMRSRPHRLPTEWTIRFGLPVPCRWPPGPCPHQPRTARQSRLHDAGDGPRTVPRIGPRPRLSHARSPTDRRNETRPADATVKHGVEKPWETTQQTGFQGHGRPPPDGTPCLRRRGTRFRPRRSAYLAAQAPGRNSLVRRCKSRPGRARRSAPRGCGCRCPPGHRRDSQEQWVRKRTGLFSR